MKPKFYLGVLILPILISGGCIKTESISSSVNDTSFESGSCQILDYGIQEFKLYSSLPILSHSHDLHIAIEQIGDCEADSLAVSIFEDDALLTQQKIDFPKDTTPLTVSWNPKKDVKVSLRVELDVIDNDFINNQETINITPNPLGNYMRINDLSGDVVSSSSAYAEYVEVKNPIHISNIEFYLQKIQNGLGDAQVNVKIYADESGQPGSVLKEVSKNIKLNDQYDWYNFPIEYVANKGVYWIALSIDGGESIIWHYSRKQVGGAEPVNPKIEFETNSSTVYNSNSQWKVLHEKDFTYKIHAGNHNE